MAARTPPVPRRGEFAMGLGFASIVLTLGMFFMPAPSICAQEPAIKPHLIVEAGRAAKPATSRPQSQWLDRIASFFRNPIVNIALITLGVIGLIFEFKMPGTTFPGGVAAICFVLFFWAHSFVGEFTLLAILLFMLGLVFLGIEVFIVPGLGFAGVAGAILMFLGLLLVTLENWPGSPDEWTNVGSTFGSLMIGLALAGVGAVALTWSLPGIPFLNQMVLKPPGDEFEPPVASSLSNSGAVSLLGAIGVASTPLRPSGKAQFGEQFLDVIAEGDFVAPGGRVKIVEIEGPRIVVHEV